MICARADWNSGLKLQAPDPVWAEFQHAHSKNPVPWCCIWILHQVKHIVKHHHQLLIIDDSQLSHQLSHQLESTTFSYLFSPFYPLMWWPLGPLGSPTFQNLPSTPPAVTRHIRTSEVQRTKKTHVQLWRRKDIPVPLITWKSEVQYE